MDLGKHFINISIGLLEENIVVNQYQDELQCGLAKVFACFFNSSINRPSIPEPENRSINDQIHRICDSNVNKTFDNTRKVV